MLSFLTRPRRKARNQTIYIKILPIINLFILHSTIFPLKNYLKQTKERNYLFIEISFKFKWFLFSQEKIIQKRRDLDESQETGGRLETRTETEGN